MKKKIKPLLPSLRERKRYLAFEIVSEKPIENFLQVSRAISDSVKGYIGDLGLSRAGIIIMQDKYDSKKQKGLIRVNNKCLDQLRASLALICSIAGQEVIVRSIGVSGIIKKTEALYL